MSESSNVEWRITGEPDDDLEISPSGQVYDWEAYHRDGSGPVVARVVSMNGPEWLLSERPFTAEHIRKIGKLASQFVEHSKGGVTNG